MYTMNARHLRPVLKDALSRFPLVFLLGAREVGKGQLAESLDRRRKVLSLDHRATLDAALADPKGFLDDAGPVVTILEAQRAPGLVEAVKARADKPGMALLTSSAPVDELTDIPENMSGSVAVFDLLPLSWAEQNKRPSPPLLDHLYEAGTSKDVLTRIPASCRDRSSEIRRQIGSGGFPQLVSQKTPSKRRAWFEAYRENLLERVVPQVAHIDNPPGFNRLLSALGRHTGRALNVLELAREVSLPNTSLRRYLDILQRTRHAFLLRPYKKKSTKRLARTAKIYVCDTGLAGLLSPAESDRRLVETWAALEIRKILSAAPWHTYLWNFRTRTGREVDFLLEREYRVVGVDVSWSKEFSFSDLAGLRSCREALGDRFRMGVLLYRGTETVAVDKSTLAVPYPIFFGIEG
jgi:predicted AAA+ superfamily ATPase